MAAKNRREFLDCVGRGMLVAGLGTSLSADLGFSSAFAEEGADSLSFGEHDALVDLLQSTSPGKLQPILIEKLNRGETDLTKLMSAAALANAESFGGEDYVGFHTAMAMLPALGMAELLPAGRQPLPVLKVLYRNSATIQEFGGPSKKTLRKLSAQQHHADGDVGVQIRNAARQTDLKRAETLFAGLADAPIDEMFNALQPAMQDDINVHRFVFAYRTRGLAELLGKEHAYDILRQCVRFCVNHEQNRVRRKYPESPIRALMPKLLDQHKLAGKSFGTRDPGDAWVDADPSAAVVGARWPRGVVFVQQQPFKLETRRRHVREIVRGHVHRAAQRQLTRKAYEYGVVHDAVSGPRRLQASGLGKATSGPDVNPIKSIA